jgi:hypothetical protein
MSSCLSYAYIGSKCWLFRISLVAAGHITARSQMIVRSECGLVWCRLGLALNFDVL